jgi:hypothetical protein
VGQGEGICDANARPAALLGTPKGGGKKIRIWGRSGELSEF